MFCGKIAVCALMLVFSMASSSDPMLFRLLPSRFRRSPEELRTGSRLFDYRSESQSRVPYDRRDDPESYVEDEPLVGSAQTRNHQRAQRRGYSGTVKDGKSSYISRYNHGVPVYGVGEPYYFSYTHNFPIGTEDFESLVNSHNLPKKYKFSGGLDVTGLLE